MVNGGEIFWYLRVNTVVFGENKVIISENIVILGASTVVFW